MCPRDAYLSYSLEAKYPNHATNQINNDNDAKSHEEARDPQGPVKSKLMRMDL